MDMVHFLEAKISNRDVKSYFLETNYKTYIRIE
jgi:hypothetical protein